MIKTIKKLSTDDGQCIMIIMFLNKQLIYETCYYLRQYLPSPLRKMCHGSKVYDD